MIMIKSRKQTLANRMSWDLYPSIDHLFILWAPTQQVLKLVISQSNLSEQLVVVTFGTCVLLSDQFTIAIVYIGHLQDT